jgi:hypothetical protein
VSCPNSAAADEAEFDKSMRIEWTKARACLMHWQEEYEIVQEEMRRVIAWLKWHAIWWEEQATKRTDGDLSILHGVVAYAFRQSQIA